MSCWIWQYQSGAPRSGRIRDRFLFYRNFIFIANPFFHWSV